MLRTFVLALGVVLAVVGAVLCVVAGIGAGIQCLVLGVLILVGVVFERWRYRRAEPRPSAGSRWEKTGERFSDPESGKIMDVYYDPASGERRYVESDTRPADGA